VAQYGAMSVTACGGPYGSARETVAIRTPMQIKGAEKRKPDLFLSKRVKLTVVEGGNNFFGDLAQVIAPFDIV
jgi:hypothetical protein